MSTGSPTGSVTIVGTAHVSQTSVDEVRETIDEQNPDVVAVELDEPRYRRMQGETPEDLDPRSLLQGGTVAQLLTYWLLSYVQARLGDRFDMTPGADMRAAIEEAEARHIRVALVDRDIQVTIQRFWHQMGLLEKFRFVGGLIKGMVGLGRSPGDFEEPLDEADLTDIDVVTMLIEEFRRFSPGGAAALIDERDAYIAHNLHALKMQGYDVVAVIGKGHEAGVRNHLASPADLPDQASLTEVPKKRFSILKIGAYLVSIAVIGFFFLLIMAGARNTLLLQLFLAWFLFNGIIAFALAKLAGAKWTSAGVGGAVAWLTSINPLLAPGWFAGYVELRTRPVNVSDINRLNELLADQSLSARELYRELKAVPLFRLVVVVAMTNIGSMIATFLFPFVILPWLAPEVGGVGGLGSMLMEGARNSLDLLGGLLP